eukprot:316442-Amorphochlora_amoeboformis.AAC.1
MVYSTNFMQDYEVKEQARIGKEDFRELGRKSVVGVKSKRECKEMAKISNIKRSICGRELTDSRPRECRRTLSSALA